MFVYCVKERVSKSTASKSVIELLFLFEIRQNCPNYCAVKRSRDNVRDVSWFEESKIPTAEENIVKSEGKMVKVTKTQVTHLAPVARILVKLANG